MDKNPVNSLFLLQNRVVPDFLGTKYYTKILWRYHYLAYL